MVAIARARKTQAGTQTLYWSSIASQMGTILLMATERGVCWTGLPGHQLEEGLDWARRWMTIEQVSEGEQVEPLRQGIGELRRYFAGERVEFSCPLDLYGTPFQLEVWQALCHIPYGETRTYAEMAQALGRPLAVRAVGAANGANPIAIIVPCHRVIGSNGSLTGYGGGLPMKEWLLALEEARR
ncbi:MAG TPA: methylated-DNA--[protein]-cysteine S-methyltransferase [Ktedonobacteraceae bacterium]|nr:methylated-DNA--[protein]-cysteine S-methyltransferase [Ktedonobacteraceae bacterium]